MRRRLFYFNFFLIFRAVAWVRFVNPVEIRNSRIPRKAETKMYIPVNVTKAPLASVMKRIENSPRGPRQKPDSIA